MERGGQPSLRLHRRAPSFHTVLFSDANRFDGLQLHPGAQAFTISPRRREGRPHMDGEQGHLGTNRLSVLHCPRVSPSSRRHKLKGPE